MARFGLALALSAVLCGTAAADPASETPAQLTDDCSYGSGQKALDACTYTIKTWKKNGLGAFLAPVYWNRGNVYSGLDRYDDAVRDFDRALQIRPDYVEAYNNRGTAYIDLGQYARALKDFDAAIRIDPKDSMAVFNHGLANDALGAHAQAIADFDKAAGLKPDDARIYAYRCLSREVLGQSADAVLVDCAKSVQIAPANSDMVAIRSFVYLQMGNLDAANRDCAAARATHPKSSAVLYACGLIERKTGDTEKGDADIAAAKAVYPQIEAMFAIYTRAATPDSAPAPAGAGSDRLELALVASDPAKAVGWPLHDLRDTGRTYPIERDLTAPGDIESAEAVVTGNGQPALALHLSATAQARLGADQGLEGRQIALVLDGRTVLAVATVRAPLGSDPQLTGNFTLEEINGIVAATYPSGPGGTFFDQHADAIWAGGLLVLLGGSIYWIRRRKAPRDSTTNPT